MLHNRFYLKWLIVYCFIILISFISCEKDTNGPEPIDLTDIISEVRVGNNIGRFVKEKFPTHSFGTAPVVRGTDQISSNGFLILQVQPIETAKQLFIGFGLSKSANSSYLIIGFDEKVFKEGYFVIDIPDSLIQSTPPTFALIISFSEKKHIDSYSLEIASGNEALVSQSTIHPLTVNNSLSFPYTYIYTHPRPDGIGATAEVGIWMFKTQAIGIDAIANWNNEPYNNKTLLEPINVLWVDYKSGSLSEAEQKVKEFLEKSEPQFKPENWHSDGYFGFYGNVDTKTPQWEPQVLNGKAWADNSTFVDNNHGRIFPAYIIISKDKFVYFTSGAFSRETGGTLVPFAGHDFISFNTARDALKKSGEWKNVGLIDFGNKYQLNSHLQITTADHDGVRVFALYDVDRCKEFPPIGEILTYRIVGTSESFSVFSEEVTELVAGYEVYRLRRSDNPPDLGQYFACSAEDGEMAVATDWWDVFDPSTHGRYFYEPPRSFPCLFYGAEEGTSCDWEGTLDEDKEKQVIKIIGYETITVPYATERAMKIRDTSTYGDGEDLLWDNYIWVNENNILLKSEDVDGGDAIELINYKPPNGNLSKKGVSTGEGAYRNLRINSFHKKKTKDQAK